MGKLLDESALLAIKTYVENHAIYKHTITTNVTLVVWWAKEKGPIDVLDAVSELPRLVTAINNGDATVVYVEDSGGDSHLCVHSISYDPLAHAAIIEDESGQTVYVYAQDIEENGDWDVEML